MEAMKVTRKQAAGIIAATFPDYKGRKIRMAIAERIDIQGTNWCEGSRNQYKFIRGAGDEGRIETAALYIPAPWQNGAEGTNLGMTPGVIAVMHSIHCGRDCGLTIYVHPADAPKYLAKHEHRMECTRKAKEIFQLRESNEVEA